MKVTLKQLKARVKSGKRPTKAQSRYIKENELVYEFDAKCNICMFNLINALGLLNSQSRYS